MVSTSLTANVEVAHLVDGTGRLKVPHAATSAIIEIGCSDFDTADETLLEKKEHSRAFLLSFEPLLEKYAVLLARGNKAFHNQASKDRSVPLAQHHRRGMVLPLAVSPSGGPVNFTVGTTAGCSSILPVADASAAAAGWCGHRLETRRVPSISLMTAIGLLGDTLPVELLKIDAQGADFELVRATPPALLRARVRAIQMEVRSPTCPVLYSGQSTCDVVETYMRGIGYTPRGGGTACPVGRNRTTGACLRPMAKFFCCERNAIFERSGAGV